MVSMLVSRNVETLQPVGRGERGERRPAVCVFVIFFAVSRCIPLEKCWAEMKSFSSAPVIFVLVCVVPSCSSDAADPDRRAAVVLRHAFHDFSAALAIRCAGITRSSAIPPGSTRTHDVDCVGRAAVDRDAARRLRRLRHQHGQAPHHAHHSCGRCSCCR